jgi:AcrR family transcriptional regulator
VETARTDDPPRPGLRERKKAKTRSLIQAHALRLFREQGYGETSIEQIAEAAEVSPSTVFRYFPTKPDLVIYDDLDERMIEAFRAQPPGTTAIEAAKASLTSLFASISADEMEMQTEREHLVRTVPELRSAMLDELTRTLNEIIELVAEHTGRPRDDNEVVALSGAVIGLSIAVWLESGEFMSEHFIERFEAGVRLLETGFHI